MAPPPRVRAERAQPRPSDWSPRPIPQVAEPLHTADPPTPTLRDLAERGQRDSLAAPVPDERPAFTSVGTEAVEPEPPGDAGASGEGWGVEPA